MISNKSDVEKNRKVSLCVYIGIITVVSLYAGLHLGVVYHAMEEPNLFGALADSFTLIPINGVTFHADSLLNSMIEFMNDYILIGFRIVLPIFCVTLLLNAILGVLAKVSPQMNMFAVGIQLKVLAGLSALFLTAGMLPGAADFVYQEMKKMVVAFIGGMM